MPPRFLLAIAVPFAAAVPLAVPLTAAPAAAQGAGVYVEANPSTVQAGERVGIRASCPDDTKPAKLHSAAFGDAVAAPQSGLLVATVTIPPTRQAALYTITLICPDTSTATTRLRVLQMNRPSRGPATGGGGTAGGSTASLLVGLGVAVTMAGIGLGVTGARRRRAGA